MAVSNVPDYEHAKREKYKVGTAHRFFHLYNTTVVPSAPCSHVNHSFQVPSCRILFSPSSTPQHQRLSSHPSSHVQSRARMKWIEMACCVAGKLRVITVCFSNNRLPKSNCLVAPPNTKAGGSISSIWVQVAVPRPSSSLYLLSGQRLHQPAPHQRSSERSRFLSGCSNGPLRNSPAPCTLRNKTSGNHRPSCCMRGGKSVERLCPIFLLQLLVDGDRLGGGGFLSGATSSEWVQGEDCASISRFHTSTIPTWDKVAHSDSFPFPLLHEPSQYNSQVFSCMKKSAIIRVAINFY